MSESTELKQRLIKLRLDELGQSALRLAVLRYAMLEEPSSDTIDMVIREIKVFEHLVNNLRHEVWEVV